MRYPRITVIRLQEELQGAGCNCLYDNKKVVMMRWEDDQPMCLCAVCNRIHERTIAIGLSLGGLCMCGAVVRSTLCFAAE